MYTHSPRASGPPGRGQYSGNPPPPAATCVLTNPNKLAVAAALAATESPASATAMYEATDAMISAMTVAAATSAGTNAATSAAKTSAIIRASTTITTILHQDNEPPFAPPVILYAPAPLTGSKRM